MTEPVAPPAQASTTALKEWAAVCHAMAAGEQSLLLRKGGISETGGQFEVERRRFWLLPTAYHQSAGSLKDSARPHWEAAEREMPPAGRIRITHFATVEASFFLSDAGSVGALDAFHVLSDETVRQRFSYRQPGLWGLVVRVFISPQTFELAETPDIAGCRSWVELPEPLSTEGITPVISDEAWSRLAGQLHAKLA